MALYACVMVLLTMDRHLLQGRERALLHKMLQELSALHAACTAVPGLCNLSSVLEITKLASAFCVAHP